MHQHEAGFLPLDRTAETERAEKQPEFQRHIEMRDAVGLKLRQIVDAPTAVANRLDDLIDPRLPEVGCFQGTSQPKMARVHGEDQRVADRFVAVGEGTVDKDARR